METIGRAAILLALVGPLAIGIAVPLTSAARLRRHWQRHTLSGVRPTMRPAVVAGTLVLWSVISVGSAALLMEITFFTAMGWGHLGTLAPIREQVELLAIVSGVLLILLGCGTVLHRFLIHRCSAVS